MSSMEIYHLAIKGDISIKKKKLFFFIGQQVIQHDATGLTKNID